ncbi:DUF6153 family protein [Nonomuraea sp. SYSU D8015]|uniref:DUF6153 family protein n=1 Tax=Nonomuraea sp. SYSU D8015 TaxID=2593644 RepID=UPI0016614F10|nr:DUF6153 family protein [Nonomuraea sp. SYSU D8015]
MSIAKRVPMGVARRRLALRAARGLLLVILALGICGMHTLGHVDGGHGGSPSTAHGMGVTQEPLVAVPPGLRAFVPEREAPGFDPAGVCLAILTSFIVVLLIAAWVRTGQRSDGGGGAPSPVQRVARPPPKPTSLRLARLSILRI